MPSRALIAIASPTHGFLWHVAAIAAVGLIAFLWILPQRDTLAGGEFAPYAASLPFSQRVRRCVDISLILIADALLLFPFGVAVIHPWLTPKDTTPDQFIALWILLALTLCLQMAVFRKPLVILAAASLAALLLSLGLSLPHVGAIAEGLAFAVALVGLFVPDRPTRRAMIRRRWPDKDGVGKLARSHPLVATTRIQWKILAAHPMATLMRMAFVLALALGADKLIGIFQFDSRALPTTVAALAGVALVLSGLYRVLRDAHRPMQPYLSSLPAHRHYWAMRDTTLVILLGLLPLTILLTPAVSHALLPFLALIGIAFGYLVLIVALRMPLIFAGGISVMLGALLAAGWAGATLAAVVR
jgi:hypothetical protein